MTAPLVTSHASPAAPAAAPSPSAMNYAHSIASDSVSLASAASLTNTPAFVANVKPAPEYISLSSASQRATDVADARAEEDQAWRLHPKATVAESAVAQVNQFLDRQLYDFINAARTTNLSALKPAVTEVLKKNLARDAIASAQDNLEDLLALQADDEFNDEFRPSSQAGARFNLEFTWKRSRLRVMMRTEKSEFDIDDDERYVREESLSTSFSETAGVISLASEIFLAGVLDYLGDVVLTLASQVAITRIQRAGSTSTLAGDSDQVTYILVEDADLERAILNSPLDRQWRAWKKSIRMLNRTSQQSPSVTNSPVLIRRGSLWDRLPDRPENHYPEHVLASNIPLPQTQRDVDEIEVPGLARDPDRPESAQQSHDIPRFHRPQSAGFGANRQYRAELAAKSRPVSVPLPITTPLVEAPGAWPTDTPAAEIVDPASRFAEGQAGEGLPSVQGVESERPESRDSAHTEKASVSSQPTSMDDQLPAMNVVQRPKRLAIYGPSSARYTQALTQSQEGLELAADLDRPFSPEAFLASRNLSGSYVGVTPTSDEGTPRSATTPAELPAGAFLDTDSGSESESVPEQAVIETAVASPSSGRASLATSPLARQFPGLGISRSDSSSSRRERTPIYDQRVSADFMRSRRTSKMTDSDTSSPGKRGSLRQISTSTNRDSLDERRRLPTSSMTSEQDFDALLRSEETIKYTLTPETVRDMPDRPFSPHARLRKQTLFRSNSKENFKRDSDAQSIRSNRSMTWSVSGAKEKKEPVEESKRKTSISRPSPQNLHALPSGQIAREPIMQTESTRDFADFIRSTGPDKEPNPVVPGIVASRSLSSLRATAQAQAASAREAPPLPKAPSTSNGKYIPRSPLGPPPKRSGNRPSLMARAATGSSDNNNDLIDFIRSGPPDAGGKARVPNHIAPFADWEGDEGADLKTTITGASTMNNNRPLTSSTSDSRTGLLLNGASHANYGSGNTPRLPMSPLTQSSSPAMNLVVPTTRPALSNNSRTRSRNKDPYAIPDDSEDDEDVLADLPGVSDEYSAVAGAEKPYANSIASMHSSAGRSPALSNGTTPTQSPNPGYDPSIRSVRSASSTTAVRPAHITSQISSGYIPRSNKPKMEVRSAGVAKSARLDPFHSSGTSDLADFLMSSGPPEPPQRSAPAPSVGTKGKAEKAEKKKSKFWQRKTTYVDMP